MKLVETVRRRLGQRYTAMRGQKSVSRAIMSAALEYALEQLGSGKKLKYNEKELTQYIVEAIQSKYKHVDEQDVTGDVTGVKTEFSGQYSELDVLEYFLSQGSIPYWASTESRQSVQELFTRLTLKKLIPLQRMIEKHLGDETFVRRLVMQFTTEQIFLLLEPIAEENRRFLDGIIKEFERSNLNTQSIKQTAVELMIGQRGRFSKEIIARSSLEKAAAGSSKSYKELLAAFYQEIQLRSNLEYDLTRSELLRIINEIEPGIAESIKIIKKDGKEAKAKQQALKARIDELKVLLEEKGLSAEAMETLKKERNQLRRQLSELQEEMQKMGIAAPESAAGIAEKRSELEKQLNSLRKIQTEEALLEQEEIRKQLSELAADFEKLQEKLIKAFEKAITPQQRQKLRSEFDHSLALLLRDRSRMQARLAEIANSLNLQLENKERRALKKQEHDIREKLKKLDDRISQIEQISEAIKLATEEKKEDSVESENSKLDFLIFFLQYGSVPWWAEAYRESSVESIFKEFAEKDSEKMRQAFSRVGRNPVVWQRLINQLSEEVLEKVLITLFPNFAGFAVSVALLLQKIIESKILPSLNGVPVKSFKWSKVTEILFTTLTALNPQSFVKDVVTEIGKEFNISPSTLLDYITNLSNNNQGTRLSIFADIVRPLTGDKDILEVEKELLETAFKRKQEEEGLVIPEDKKYEVLSDFILKGVFADIAFKAGYSSAAAMEQLLLELMTKQPSAIQKLLETVLSNPPARRRLSLEFSDAVFWEIVLMIGARTMPIIKKYITDLGIALGDERMSVAKEALLKYIIQSSDRPFIMRDYMQILLKDATQVTQRQRIAIINEWKRKVYQAPSYSSSLILALMQTEIQDIKEQSEATEDQTEKENLKEQMQNLQMEYQQLSQRLVYILHKEQPQIQGDIEIPTDPEELYKKIADTEAEIEKLRLTLLEKTSGEQLLQQIVNQKQIAIFEGELELLMVNEPFSVRLLKTQEKELDIEIEKAEAALAEYPQLKSVAMPPLPESEELEQLSDDMENGYVRLRERLRRLPGEERTDWIDFVREMGWEDILTTWEQEEQPAIIETEAELLKSLPKLNLEELSEIWLNLENRSDYLQRRVQGHLRTLIAKTLQKLRKEQKALLEGIEKSETAEKADDLRRQLLNLEMSQNDRLNPFFAAPIDNNLRQSLVRVRNNIRLSFLRIRAAVEIRKAEIAETERVLLGEVVKQKKEQKEELEKVKKETIEQLKTGKKPKSEVKPVKKDTKKKAEKPVDEPLYIKNAGLVLLHPYFHRLFSMLNLLEKNKFISEEAQIKGVHLLQFIATGKTEHPENELVLNKIICGLPLSTPVPMDIGLSDEEKRIASGLLSGAIANWPRMKTMTPDALRGTFILREGNIKEEADRWKLKVEKGSFDILLKTIPWAFNFVRMGFMPKFISVEWPLPGG
jgi:hypothetical protein